MRNLTIDEINYTSGGADYFCVVFHDVGLMCDKLYWDGKEFQLVGNIQPIPVTFINGEATFVVG